MKIWIERFRKLPTPLLILHMFARALFAFGLGLLLGGAWGRCGLPLIIVALLLAVYPAYKILSGK